MTTIYSGLVLDTPESPFTGGELRSEQVALVVSDGMISFRGQIADARAHAPDADVVQVEGVLVPGFVDTHVHYPQLPIIGGLGMPLMQWLDNCALPQEARLADPDHAQEVAQDFLTGLTVAGTTTALVFGSHYASAMDIFFQAASGSGLRITSGLVVGDRLLRDDLHTTPQRALAEAGVLIKKWHGKGRLRYAVTPRFSLATTSELLQACAETLASADDLLFTSHLNENSDEIATVAELFPQSSSYLDTYDQFSLIGPRSVLAHNVHPTEAELLRLGQSGASVAHCPSSNSALGSGLFPLAAHLAADVPVALGSDVGAGTGLNLLQQGIQAYFHQRLRDDGYPLTPTHLLYLATQSGAQALKLAQVGHLSVGMQFDAVQICPPQGSTLSTVLRGTDTGAQALATIFTLGTDADIAQVWVGGDPMTGQAAARVASDGLNPTLTRAGAQP